MVFDIFLKNKCLTFLQVKTKHELKQKLFERKRDHLLAGIEIAEEDAFVCEVPGWNNQTYIDAVNIMRQAEPLASPRITGGGAARSPTVARSPGGAARSSGNVAQIREGMARARITEMEDSD